MAKHTGPTYTGAAIPWFPPDTPKEDEGVNPFSGQPDGTKSSKEADGDGGDGDATTPTAAPKPPVGRGYVARARASAVRARLTREGRWGEIEPIRDEMMRGCRKTMGLSKSDAQLWTYDEIDRLYPPLPPVEAVEAPEKPPDDTGSVQGLGDIPDDWPALPATGSLQSDLQWVQSNRLTIVEDQHTGGTRVYLGRAHEPAPSRAALGWLETSIRAYAKFVDVVARSLATVEDEVEHVRRERMRIEDIKALLREMRAT